MRAIVSVLFVLIVLPGAVRAQPGQQPPQLPPPPGEPPPPEAAPAQPYPPPPPYGDPAQSRPDPGPYPGPYPGQPYPGQPYPGQPYPGQPYPGQPYPPPPPYGPPAQLTPDEQKLLAQGEISLGAHAGGVALDWFFGFGLGQAVQGRWSDTGWMFTLGEAAGITLIVAGFSRLCFDCDTTDSSNNDDAGALLAAGVIGYLVVHAWSIVDAAIGPSRHNGRVRELKRRVGLPVEATRIIPYASPVGGGGGGTAGLTFRF